MSHNLFRHSILCNARVWDFLRQVDAAEAEACRAAGCPRCGGALHSATYPRKPHGLAPGLWAESLPVPDDAHNTVKRNRRALTPG